MDNKALGLLVRFALSAKCSSEINTQLLLDCIKTGNYTGVETELKKFKFLYSYLRLISEVFVTSPFTYEVARAYCFGDSRLTKFEHFHFLRLLQIYKEQGVKPQLIDRLRTNLLNKFVPHHDQKVLHADVILVGLTGTEATDAANKCLVREGTVTDILNGFVTLTLRSVNHVGGTFKPKTLTEELLVARCFVSGIKVGDTVAVHGGYIIAILTKEEKKKIEDALKLVLKSF
ncbi:MAG: DUF6390 family protein [candidate division WWE3 bacterium]|nr:DUF6390 family protein [candidate division WWE3 bacterium]